MGSYDTYSFWVNELIQMEVTKNSNVGEKNLTVEKQYYQFKQYIIDPANLGKCSRNRTNNDCESANHILKIATFWKRIDIPKFIDLSDNKKRKKPKDVAQ